MRVRHIYAWLAGSSLLLLLLVILQVTWLRKASAMEEKERNNHIIRALEQVEKQLSHNIDCFEGYSKIFIPQGDRFYMVHEATDRTTGKTYNDTINIFYDPADAYPENAILKEKVAHYKYPVSLEIQLNMRLMADQHLHLPERSSGTGNGIKTYRDIITNNLGITELVSTEKTDSLIAAMLLKEHLSPSGYGFGFLSEQDGRVDYTKRITDTAGLLASPFHVALFRDNKFAKPYRLMVLFPTLPGVDGITIGLMISIIIIILLTIAFYFFIRLYIKQAKLYDMKNDFINNLTHEFNTPMANIALAVETLQEHEAANSPKVQRILDIIGSESLRLRGNIERALQIASMEKGNLSIYKEPLDLVAVVQTVIDGYSLSCGQLGGTIGYNHPPRIMITGDELQLSNSIGNLLDNAIKYRRDKPIIGVTLTINGDEASITIADNGRGMSRETMRHIFDKFYRADEGNRHSTKGFGLGLNYAKGIIELHGGTITLTSKEGEGTTFIIHLPIATNDGN